MVNVFIYLTIIYRILIYKSLFVSSFWGVFYGQKRYLIVLVSLEVFGVVCFGAHFSKNIIRVSPHFNYLEVAMPLIIAVIIFVVYHRVLNMDIHRIGLCIFLYFRTNYSHYVWAKYSLSLVGVILDKCLYFMGGALTREAI